MKYLTLSLLLFSIGSFAAMSASGSGDSAAEAVKRAHLSIICVSLERQRVVIIDKTVSQSDSGKWTASILYECIK